MTPLDAAKLLERLQLRTESRGATASEAASAAELAERIIRRYALDRDARSTATESHVLGQNRLPGYAVILAMALERRFECRGDYLLRRGQRCVVRFHGPEHTCRIACWLFAAVLKDLNRLADRHVKAKGSEGYRLRNRFRSSAAWEIYWRLNPPPRDAMVEVATQEDTRKRPRNSRCRRQEIRDVAELRALVAGREAGQQIQLSTDVLGGSAPERLRLV